MSGKNLAHLAWSEAIIEDKIWNKHKSFGSWEMQVKIVFSYSPRVSSSFAFNPSEQCQNRNLPQITDKHRKCFGPPNSPISCRLFVVLYHCFSQTSLTHHPTCHRFHAKRKARATVAVKTLKILLFAAVFFCHQKSQRDTKRVGPMPFSYTVYNYSVYTQY